MEEIEYRTLGDGTVIGEDSRPTSGHPKEGRDAWQVLQAGRYPLGRAESFEEATALLRQEASRRPSQLEQRRRLAAETLSLSLSDGTRVRWEDATPEQLSQRNRWLRAFGVSEEESP